MNILFHIFVVLKLESIFGVISEEEKEDELLKSDRIGLDFPSRRFLVDVEDGRRLLNDDDCSTKRRINDAGFVQFVTAQGLNGQDKCELLQENVQKTDSKSVIKEVESFYNNTGNTSSTVNKTDNKAEIANLKSEIHKNSEDNAYANKIDSKTTKKTSIRVDSNNTLIDKTATSIDSTNVSVVTNNGTEKGRRSEYVFSSMEYYDDVEDFSVGWCPDVVEVVTLQMDELRDYDIVCASMVQWRSLREFETFGYAPW